MITGILEYPTTRLAPSPTGYLHLGHVAHLLFVHGIARAAGGRIVLRIEDHDSARCRPEFEAAILDDLEWLGFAPEQGLPQEFRTGPTPYRQSDRHARYAECLESLQRTRQVYACDCSRRVHLTRSGGGGGELRYDGFCRDRGLDFAPGRGIRVALDPLACCFDDLLLGAQRQCASDQCGDLLIRDRHGHWTYQFAVTVDDWDQDITLIIRGEDLLSSTARQVQLAAMLGRSQAPVFCHHPLITDSAGQKLSKRDFAKAIRDLRAEGAGPREVLGEAAYHCGLTSVLRPLSLEETPALFSITP